MTVATGSVGITLEDKGGGITARCHDLGLSIHARTEEAALLQLKALLDRKCPGVRVHLARDARIYARSVLRSGERRGVIPDVSTAVIPKRLDLSTPVSFDDSARHTAATHPTSHQ